MRVLLEMVCHDIVALRAFACLWFVIVIWLRWQLNRMTPEELENDRTVRAIIKRLRKEMDRVATSAHQ